MSWGIESQELRDYLDSLVEEYDQLNRDAYIKLFNHIFSFIRLDSKNFQSVELYAYNTEIDNKTKKRKIEGLRKNIQKVKEEYIELQKQLGFDQYVDIDEAVDNMFNKKEILFGTHCDRAVKTLKHAYDKDGKENIKMGKLFQTKSQFLRERKLVVIKTLHGELFSTPLGYRIISKSMYDETNNKEYHFYKLYRLVCQEFGYPVNQVCTVFRDYKPIIVKKVK